MTKFLLFIAIAAAVVGCSENEGGVGAQPALTGRQTQVVADVASTIEEVLGVSRALNSTADNSPGLSTRQRELITYIEETSACVTRPVVNLKGTQGEKGSLKQMRVSGTGCDAFIKSFEDLNLNKNTTLEQISVAAELEFDFSNELRNKFDVSKFSSTTNSTFSISRPNDQTESFVLNTTSSGKGSTIDNGDFNLTKSVTMNATMNITERDDRTNKPVEFTVTGGMTTTYVFSFSEFTANLVIQTTYNNDLRECVNTFVTNGVVIDEDDDAGREEFEEMTADLGIPGPNCIEDLSLIANL